MKRNWLVLIVFVLAALCGSLAPRAIAQTPANSYTGVRLNSLGGSQTWAYGLNDSGQVVGESYTALGSSHAYLWQNGAMTDLGTLGGANSAAYAINTSGQVVGGANTAANGQHAFLWTAGTGMRDLGTLGGGYSFAYGINDMGQVVGTANTAAGAQHAFLWKNGVMVDLGVLGGYFNSTAYGINASGQVVGSAEDASGHQQAFRWTPTVPNGTSGTMAALSANGKTAYGIDVSEIVVGQTYAADGSHAALWDSLGTHDLQSIYGGDGIYYFQTTGAYAINGSGVVVGSSGYYYYDPDSGAYYQESRAVVWDNQGGIRDLTGRSFPYVGGFPVGVARGINASGQIAANGDGYDDYSGGTAYLLTPSPLPTPPGLSERCDDRRVSLFWSGSTGADTYHVKRATTSGGPYTTIATVGPGTGYVDTTVGYGITYYYVVSALNQWGESADSNEPSVTPIIAPTGLIATAGDRQVSLAWSATIGADRYDIYRSTTPGGSYQFASSSNLTNYTDTGYWGYDEWGNEIFYPVENGVTYYYVVVALNYSGQSGYSNEASATPMLPPPPPAPTGVTATAGDTFVSLAWNASTGAYSYSIKRATTSGGPYMTVATTGGTTYKDETLTNGVTYYYVVSAVNSGGESPNSSQVSATPIGPPPPAAPTKLTASATGKKQINLKWTQSSTSGVTQNRIYRATTSGGPYAAIATLPAATSYVDKSVTSGVTFYYVVTALKSAKESAASNQASASAR